MGIFCDNWNAEILRGILRDVTRKCVTIGWLHLIAHHACCHQIFMLLYTYINCVFVSLSLDGMFYCYFRRWMAKVAVWFAAAVYNEILPIQPQSAACTWIQDYSVSRFSCFLGTSLHSSVLLFLFSIDYCYWKSFW